MTTEDPDAVALALQVAEARIAELEAERDTWRALLIEVVGDEVAERMFEATR